MPTVIRPYPSLSVHAVHSQQPVAASTSACRSSLVRSGMALDILPLHPFTRKRLAALAVAGAFLGVRGVGGDGVFALDVMLQRVEAGHGWLRPVLQPVLARQRLIPVEAVLQVRRRGPPL